MNYGHLSVKIFVCYVSRITLKYDYTIHILFLTRPRPNMPSKRRLVVGILFD